MDKRNEFKKMCDAAKQLSEEKYKENSRRRLSNIISKKFETTMIGSLDIIEKNLGFLWGHGKDYGEKSTSEKMYYDLYQEIRTQILDKGNNQLRLVQTELSEYNISWNRYKQDFIIKKRS